MTRSNAFRQHDNCKVWSWFQTRSHEDNRSTTNSLDFSNKNPPIDPSKSPRSYKHFDPIADRIPRVVVELSSQM
ncbi:hypothetical protein, variant [Blastomyces gilchristii SLH14081]|uniref:Uncharacterized protein n=1 Tax=Blastomyces gilchristii (strain SLH14081) TaxID=559298 RepID=A0A179UHT5_BLAGS|nr:uncharacterized protein BDBG_03600 [Blastomyces gilchristii SLH14081]XP_031577838.1 hypothetical protein, variant [Blastomyces gilchristii SLH14081]OAT07554.1 hypothetical protein BDBG_03600 [Blastomyces gilchristii SLH14081]OAT07555.1 hypothetical protein, variant [Blastomyces gilchristii SLH14081]